MWCISWWCVFVGVVVVVVAVGASVGVAIVVVAVGASVGNCGGGWGCQGWVVNCRLYGWFDG
jgi:hypothetical protein